MHREIIECLSGGILLLDRDFTIKSIDEGGCRIIGCRSSELVGRHFGEVFNGEIDEEALFCGKITSGREVQLSWNGRNCPVLLNLIPLCDVEGLRGVIVYFKSIEKCAQCLKKLDEKERIFRVVFDSVAEGIFTVNGDMVITSFNRAAERITGYKREEVIGRKCYEIFRSFHCDKACPLKTTLEQKEPVENKEVVVKAKDGRKIFLLVNTSVLYDDEGNVHGCVETFRELDAVKPIEKRKFGFGKIVGNSLKMQAIFKKLPVIADSDLNVLIQGETGTGKDLLARTIHEHSDRRNKPFMKISCASIPDTLLESELFGYKRGAFTGAIKDKPGKLELCNGGTIYLDEVADIPLHLQVKLLRVVEEHEFEKLGGTSTVKVDVRIIAATNRNLEEEVKKGNFREDLYYRLNVLSIELPPLRERRDDIPLLIEHFIDTLNKKRRKDVIGIDEEALRILCSYRWPGNIRELQNVLEYVFVQINSRVIGVEHLPPYLRERGKDMEISSIAEMEEKLIRKALAETGGNKNRAARLLGIPRTTLWRKMKKYGISVPSPLERTRE